MKCYFLRHGLAGDAERWEGSDEDRPLTDEGKARMAREAATIAALDLDIDVIISSPLRRARQTAAIVAEALDVKVESDARLGIAFDANALHDILGERRDCEGLMLVGHEPGMSLTIGAVIGGGQVAMKKGGLACVALDAPGAFRGELLWLLPPKVLADRK